MERMFRREICLEPHVNSITMTSLRLYPFAFRAETELIHSDGFVVYRFIGILVVNVTLHLVGFLFQKFQNIDWWDHRRPKQPTKFPKRVAPVAPSLAKRTQQW